MTGDCLRRIIREEIAGLVLGRSLLPLTLNVLLRRHHLNIPLFPVLDSLQLHFLLLLFLLLPHVVPVDADRGKVGLLLLRELQAESFMPIAVLVVHRV